MSVVVARRPAVGDRLALVERASARALGRAIDPQSLRNVLTSLERGETLTDALRAIGTPAAETTEASALPSTLRALLGCTPPPLFVRAAWRVLHGRGPTPGEAESGEAAIAEGMPRLAWLRSLRALAVSRRLRTGLRDVAVLDRGGPVPAGPPDLAELLRLPDDAFLALAYEALLGRPIDADGLRLSLAELDAGRPRMSLLRALARSTEARRHAGCIPGWQRGLRDDAARLLDLAGAVVRRVAKPAHPVPDRTS